MPMYYRPTDAEVMESIDGLVRIRITTPPRLDEIIEHRIAGWMERAMELHECVGISVDVHHSPEEDNPFTEFHLTWSQNAEESRECG